MNKLQGGFLVVSRWMEKGVLKGFLMVDTTYRLHMVPMDMIQARGFFVPYLNAQYDAQFKTLVGTDGSSLSDYPVINKDYILTKGNGVVVMSTVLDAKTKKPIGVVAFNGMGTRFNLSYAKLNELLRRYPACNFKMEVDKTYGLIAVRKDGSYFDTVEIVRPEAKKKEKGCVDISNPGAMPVLGVYNLDEMRKNEFNQPCQEKLVLTMLNMSKLTPYYYTVLAAIPRKPAPLGTMGVTEDTLYYDPKFVAQLKVSELTFVLIHEIMHLAMQHSVRFGTRKFHDLWNIATDLYINSIICKDFKVKFGGGEVNVGSSGSPVSIKTPDFGIYIETIGEKIDLAVDTPESIYEKLLKENQQGSQSGSQSGQSGNQNNQQQGSQQGGGGQNAMSVQQAQQAAASAAQMVEEGIKQVREGAQRADQQAGGTQDSQQAKSDIDKGLSQVEQAAKDANNAAQSGLDQQQMQQSLQNAQQGMQNTQQGINNMNSAMQNAAQQGQQGQQGQQSGQQGQQGQQSGQQGQQSGQQGQQSGQSGTQGSQQGSQSGAQSGQPGAQGSQSGSQSGQPGGSQMSPQAQMQRGMNQIQQGLSQLDALSQMAQAMGGSAGGSGGQSGQGGQPGQQTGQGGKGSGQGTGQSGQSGQMEQKDGQSGMPDKSQGQGQGSTQQSSVGEDDFSGSGEYSPMQDVNVTYNGKKLTGSIMKDVMSNKEAKTKDDLQANIDSSRRALQTISTKIEMEEKELGQELAKNAGAGGKLTQRYIEVGLSAGMDWRVLFKNVCKDKPKKTFTLATPNQDYMNMGMTLADRRRIGKPTHVSHVKFAIDVSGSVSQKELTMTLSEINNIFNYFKIDGELIYWSTMVGDAGAFSSLKDMLKVKPESTGGTDVRCVFDYLAGKTKVHGKSEVDRVRDMKAIFIITDGCFSHNYEDYAEMFGRRVVWLITGIKGNTITFDPPFGRVLSLNIEE